MRRQAAERVAAVLHPRHRAVAQSPAAGPLPIHWARRPFHGAARAAREEAR